MSTNSAIEVTPDSDDSLTLTHVRRRVGRDQRGGGRRPRLASSGAQRRNRAALPQLRVVSGLFWRQMKRPQQLTDLIVRLGDVPHPHFAVQVVAVAAADLRAIDVSGLDEVGDDSLRRSLGDPDGRGDVSDSRFPVASDAEQYLGVVGEERPGVNLFRT